MQYAQFSLEPPSAAASMSMPMSMVPGSLDLVDHQPRQDEVTLDELTLSRYWAQFSELEYPIHHSLVAPGLATNETGSGAGMVGGVGGVGNGFPVTPPRRGQHHGHGQSTVSPAMLMTQDVGLSGLSSASCTGFDPTLGLMTPNTEPHTFRRFHQHQLCRNNNSDNANLNDGGDNNNNSKMNAITPTATPSLGRMKTEHGIDNALGLFPDTDPHHHHQVQQQHPQLHLPPSFLHQPQPLLHGCVSSSSSSSPIPASTSNSSSLTAANLYLPTRSPCHGVNGNEYPMTPISPSAQLLDPSSEIEMQRFVQHLSGMLPCGSIDNDCVSKVAHTPLLPTLSAHSYPSPIPTPPTTPPRYPNSPETSSPPQLHLLTLPSLPPPPLLPPTQSSSSSSASPHPELDLIQLQPHNSRTARTAARSTAQKGTRSKRIAARASSTRSYKHRTRRRNSASPLLIAPPLSRARTRHISPNREFKLDLTPSLTRNLNLGLDVDIKGEDVHLPNGGNGGQDVELVCQESKFGLEIVVFDANREERRKWKCRKCSTIVGRKPDLHRHYKSCVTMEKHFCKDVVTFDGTHWSGCGVVFSRRDALHRHLRKRFTIGCCAKTKPKRNKGESLEEYKKKQAQFREMSIGAARRAALPNSEKNRLVRVILPDIKVDMF